MFIPSSLVHAVNKVARQTIGKDWTLYAALLDHWQEIVGQDYASITTPVKITFPHQPNEQHRHGGVLSIRLPKGLAMEFSFKTDQMKQRINSYFGYDALSRIIFDPVFAVPPVPVLPPVPIDPVALATISETSKSIDNDELREALERFGTSVLKGTVK